MAPAAGFYKVIYDFYILWKTHTFDAGKADVGDEPKVKKNTLPIPLTGKADTTIYFVFSVMYLPAKSFFTSLFSLRFTHKSYVCKEMQRSDFKVAPLKEYFVS